MKNLGYGPTLMGSLPADPRICPAAKSLPEVNFAKAVELAYHGAKVLHPKAACLAIDSGIPVWIRSHFVHRSRGPKSSRMVM